jgi:RND family efflux transporter MFP subunit
MKKKFLYGIMIIVLVAAGFMAVRAFFPRSSQQVPAKAQKKPLTVRVVIVSVAPISNILELTGSVRPYRAARLASAAEGPVLKVNVREGDWVKVGDTLLSIGRREGIEASIISLREDLKKEEDNLRRTQQLVETLALPGEDLDQAKANCEKARAALAKALETSGDYSITAPWNGMISRILVEVGNYTAPRVPLLEMYDPTTLIINVSVPERHAAHLKRGGQATVSLDAYPDTVFKATVSRVYPYLEERMRTRSIELELKDRVDILPGMFARVGLNAGTIDSALVIPAQALVATQNAGTIVYITTGGKAFQRTVRVGIEEGGRAQIIDGIQLGDSVIISGLTGLSNGTAVEIVDDSSSQKTTRAVSDKPDNGTLISKTTGSAK